MSGLQLGPHVERQSNAAALLRARSAELSEVRRRNVRLTAGYGDATGREVMDDEARAAQARYEALDAVLAALRMARAAAG